MGTGNCLFWAGRMEITGTGIHWPKKTIENGNEIEILSKLRY